MHTRLQQALQQLPENLQSAVQPMLQDGFNATFSAAQVAELKQSTGLDDPQLQLALLPLAAAFAVVPISNFQVGAIARGKTGSLYLGANFEFSGNGLFHSIHAEQSAISNAWSHNETGLRDVTVTATPCGHCRQFMNELTTAQTMEILLPDDQSKLQAFLPHSFGPADLGMTDGLMTPMNHHLAIDSEDPLAKAALEEANRSYAPYTKGFAAIALEFADGSVYCGRYAENAAFNPSLPPMQMACNLANLHHADLSTIKRALLVENERGMISQQDSAQSALSALSSLSLEVIKAS
ncbi:cytidine deaminase [Dongshaea marina]|uniref:cytidine deaminase n=1 Tax=Dongshaea marina TaxID=2047966 RepID=UPI000D3E711C|nr:cytidine deaminase [Dongshaea marina]